MTRKLYMYLTMTAGDNVFIFLHVVFEVTEA